jgi:hypothetical protein
LKIPLSSALSTSKPPLALRRAGAAALLPATMLPRFALLAAMLQFNGIPGFQMSLLCTPVKCSASAGARPAGRAGRRRRIFQERASPISSNFSATASVLSCARIANVSESSQVSAQAARQVGSRHGGLVKYQQGKSPRESQSASS